MTDPVTLSPQELDALLERIHSIVVDFRTKTSADFRVGDIVKHLGPVEAAWLRDWISIGVWMDADGRPADQIDRMPIGIPGDLPRAGAGEIYTIGVAMNFRRVPSPAPAIGNALVERSVLVRSLEIQIDERVVGDTPEQAADDCIDAMRG